MGFNPRTHEGCDHGRSVYCQHPGGFNPRTHEGCDFLVVIVSSVCRSFNPRTHEGCDCLVIVSVSRIRVSIHAPTRGATINRVKRNARSKFQSTHPRGVRLCIFEVYRQLQQFQSTHPRGVRLILTKIIWRGHRFQSTHPRGVRPGSYALLPSIPCFNPRTHEGCDDKQLVGG